MDQGTKGYARDVITDALGDRTNGRKPRSRRTRVRARTFAHRDIVREIRENRARALVRSTVTDLETAAKALELDRPKTRADCVKGYRPCPFVGCSHHLYLTVNPNGSIKITFPDVEPWEMQRSCALDEADQGGHTLEEIGERMNLTRERARQIEVNAFGKLRTAGDIAIAEAEGRLAAYVTPARAKNVDGPDYND